MAAEEEAGTPAAVGKARGLDATSIVPFALPETLGGSLSPRGDTRSVAEPTLPSFSSGVSLPVTAAAAGPPPPPPSPPPPVRLRPLSPLPRGAAAVDLEGPSFRVSEVPQPEPITSYSASGRRAALSCFIAPLLLRLHYVTQPLLQGRGPRGGGEGAHARAAPPSRPPACLPTAEPALGLCSETPRTCREDCAAAGGVRVRKLGSWDVPEEFPWEDFVF